MIGQRARRVGLFSLEINMFNRATSDSVYLAAFACALLLIGCSESVFVDDLVRFEGVGDVMLRALDVDGNRELYMSTMGTDTRYVTCQVGDTFDVELSLSTEGVEVVALGSSLGESDEELMATSGSVHLRVDNVSEPNSTECEYEGTGCRCATASAELSDIVIVDGDGERVLEIEQFEYPTTALRPPSE